MSRLYEKKVALFENYLAVTEKLLTALPEDLGALIEQRFSIITSVDALSAQIALDKPSGTKIQGMEEKIQNLLKQIQTIDTAANLRIQQEYKETEQLLKQGNVNIKYATAMKGYFMENQTGRVIDERK